MVTLVFVCSGQMYTEHNAHLALYLNSFDFGQNAQQFLFLLKLAALGKRFRCGRGPMITFMAAWTGFVILLLGDLLLF